MNDDKHLIIYFNNGTNMEIWFPTQIEKPLAAVIRILESDSWWDGNSRRYSLVQHLEGIFDGAALPFGASKGAGFPYAQQNENDPPSHLGKSTKTTSNNATKRRTEMKADHE